MGRIHPYGEPRMEDSPIGEFFCWLFVIGLGFPMAYGWIFVSLGWINNPTLFELSAAVGVIVGLKAAHDTVRRKKQKEQAGEMTPLSTSEGETVVLLNPAQGTRRSLEEHADNDNRDRRGYGR